MSSGSSNVKPRKPPSKASDSEAAQINSYPNQSHPASKLNHNSGNTRSSNNKSGETTAIGQQQQSSGIDSNLSIDSSKPKANQCDKLLSMFDGTQENNKSILRVNLLKKSNRQPHLSPSTGRRLLQKQYLETPKAQSIQASNDSGATSIAGTSDGAKDGRLIKADNGRMKKDDEYSSNYEEAKKSQKLVLSLIKDISKTVKKEDLDEMLKEINLAIGEIQQSQDKESKLRKTKQNKQPVKSKIASYSSGASNSSDLKEEEKENEVDKLDCDEDFDDEASHSNAINAKSRGKTFKREQNSILGLIEANVSDLAQQNDDLSSDGRRHKIHKQLMDLTSDEDPCDDRKPNSSRLPDRCLRVTSSHAKYISPHRKRSLEERLSRAQEARERFLEYRANKFRDILKKVEEMRAWKEEDTLNLKASVQIKLQKAAEKRKEQLDRIIRKAHDEESKVSEIQFINNLEAQNRRHDMNSRKKEFEARLQDLQDERQRRFEEKQAKEVAAEERRKTIEAERKAKLVEIQQRRKLKTQKVEQQQQVKEKKRLERNRNRDQKITAIKEAYNAGVQTLKKRIHQKQEQSERRHEVNLRLIRQKAFELSIKRYNSFSNKLSVTHTPDLSGLNSRHKQEVNSTDTKRLQLKPFNTKKFCNLCKETISSEAALFSHLRSEAHHSSISEHYGNTMLTTNEAVEIHNLRHIEDTDEPLDGESSQHSSRASSLVNYYHSSHLSQTNGDICMSESDRDSLLAIEKKCRKLRHKLVVAGKPFNRDWFSGKIRARLAELLIKQRVAKNQTTNTEAASLANTIDLSANNVNCQHNKPFYLKINRITRELIGITTDQRISGGGLMPAGIIHSVDRLLADLNKQLTNRKVPQLLPQLLQLTHQQKQPLTSVSGLASGVQQHSDNQQHQDELSVDQLAMATKMIEFYAIDTLFLYDIVSCLVSILRRIVPNVSLTSKLPSTVANHYSTLIDPISLNSYYCHRSPILSARIYIKMIGFIKSLCENHADLCYVIFQSNNMIFLSDILSYRLGFIIGNESPASSISGSSSAATLSAQTIGDGGSSRKGKQQNYCASSSANSSFAVQKSPGLTRAGSSTSGGGGNQLDHNDSSNRRREGDDNDEIADDELWGRRAETYKRTDEIVDDMTAGLCKLLATVAETILSRPLILLNQIDKMAFDQRSDDFISYMVSVGIVDTESVIMSHIHQQQTHHQQQQTFGLSVSQSNINNIAAATTNSDKGADTSASSGGGSSSVNHQQPGSSAGSGSQTTLATIHQQQQQSQPMCNSGGGGSACGGANASGGSVSTSNKIINFTTSCIQFVTSLVKLVIAELPPDDQADNQQAGELVAQQDPTQLLATLKMTQLSGVLTLVYDMLVQNFNSLTEPSPLTGATEAPARQPQEQEERQLGLALHSLRLINYVAYINVELLQASLAPDEMLPLQLRHVCGYLISYLVQHGGGGGKMEPSPDPLKGELLNEIILLLGHFAYLSSANQLMLKSGRRPTIIEQLTQLPFDYFSRSNLKLVLMPTLISCAYLNDQICALVCQELSLSMLTSFIEDQLLEAQLESKQQSADKRLNSSLLVDDLTNTKLAVNRWRFERRFAKSKWLSAKKYFLSQQAKMRLKSQ